MNSLHDLVRRITEGEALSRAEASEAIDHLLDGDLDPALTAALLTAWKTRGETAAEISGVVDALRRRMVAVESPLAPLVDTCGTGGDGHGTFNVSTAAAFVAAGAGVFIAKHGNRAVSSRSGSADVLEALGVRLDVPADRLADLLGECGSAFFFAPNHHPALAKVGPIRRALRLRTIFNIAGPLLNPASARRQVLGVYRPELLNVVADALAETGCEAAWVVHGEGGLDELTTTGTSWIVELGIAGRQSRELEPEAVGLRRARIADLAGGDAAENAAILRRVLAGEQGAIRDVVVLNAAAAIVLGGRAPDLIGGIAAAELAIDSGAAQRVLEALIGASQRLAP